MGVFNNFTHPLTFSFLFVVIVIRTSWSVNVNASAGQNPAIMNHGNPASSEFYHQPKQIDERISNLIAENVLHFGHQLGLELAALDPHAEKSEIFSPLSIMTALSLLMLGAKGKSYQELKQLLALDSDSELIQNPSKYHEEFGMMLNDLENSNVNYDGVYKRPNANWRFTTLKRPSIRVRSRAQPVVPHIIKVANGLFLQSGNTLNPDYRQVIESIYKSVLTPLDFQNHNREARDYINEWVNKATFGKIPQIITGDIDKTTNIILASALYFKAFWETSFFPKGTTDDYFYPDGPHNPPIKVKMMPNGGIFPTYNAKEYDCSIIGLPYKGNETTMYVIQPNNSTRQRLRELQHVLNARKINEMIDKMERKTAVMVFPKMHFTRSLNMKNILRNMNINDIFVNGLSNLSLIGGGPPDASLPVTDSISTPSPLPALSPHPDQSPLPVPSPHLVQTSLPVQSPHLVQTSLPVQSPLPDQSPLPVQSPLPDQSPLPVQPSVPIAMNKNTILFEDINRKPPVQQMQYLDRFNEPSLIFTSRFGGIEEVSNQTMAIKSNNNATTVESLSEDQSKSSNNRTKRDVAELHKDIVQNALLNLETDRAKIDSYLANHFVDEIIHKVDFSVDEQGTEAAAATLTYLHRSGTDIVFRGDTPFLILIRHDPTKLPLFYGIINKPEL